VSLSTGFSSFVDEMSEQYSKIVSIVISGNGQKVDGEKKNHLVLKSRVCHYPVSMSCHTPIAESHLTEEWSKNDGKILN